MDDLDSKVIHKQSDATSPVTITAPATKWMNLFGLLLLLTKLVMDPLQMIWLVVQQRHCYFPERTCLYPIACKQMIHLCSLYRGSLRHKVLMDLNLNAKYHGTRV